MLELVLLIFFLSSLAGLAVLVLKKIPSLANLPASAPREPLLVRLKNKVKNLPGSETFNYELYLQKILSRIRILTLKTEQKTGHWLEQLRQKSSQRQISRKDDYWEELKKEKSKKSR